MSVIELVRTMNSYLWGDVFVFGTIAIGLYFTIRSKFFTFFHFGHIWKNTVFKKTDSSHIREGQLSPYEALCVAVGGTVGTGNISGVAAAIAVGGPGAIFWLWLYSILGMTIKIVEVTLGCYYRSKTPNGEYFGGPSYYMEKGLGRQKGLKIGFLFAWMFGLFFSLQWIVSGQLYAVAESVNTSFGVPPLLFIAFYSILLFYVVNKGVSKLGRLASKAVPFMTLAYLLGGIILIVLNIGELPGIIALIFKSAFTGTAALGGFAGSTVRLAIQKGLSRAVNSNEAGQGSSPMVHATADTVHPVAQGLWGAIEVFIDTIIVCSITALAILCTGTWTSGATSVSLTTSAFESAFGTAGVAFIGIMMFLFAVTTSGGWYSYYNTLLNHAFSGNEERRKKVSKIFRKIYPLPLILFTSMLFYTDAGANTFWEFIDACVALPIYVNLVTIVLLSNTFFKLLKDYRARYLHIGTIEPGFQYFYDTEPNEEAKAHDRKLMEEMKKEK